MITKDKLAELLRYLEFAEQKGVFKKDYPNGASIEVNFNTQNIIYAPLDATFKEGEFPSKNKPAKGFVIHRQTTLNFSAKENFVCLVCVHLLLKKGYSPKHIVFEPAFKSGHVNKPSYGDILVFDKEYNPLVLIENKTYGSEFSKEWNNMLKDGGQLFSYLGGMSQTTGYCENLVLYAVDFDEKLVPKSHIITLKDNEKRLKELDNPKTFQDAKDKLFDVWSETYAKSFETKGLFEDDVDPYTVGKLKYTIKDLEGLSHAEIRPIYHEFATILRNHAITDFEHSFYILVDLFLCKITDERNNPDDLQFRYKGITRDTPKEYCARLLNLYQQGKKQLFGVDVINKNESDISQIFEETQRSKNGLYDGIKELFEEIKFYNIKKFNFIDVENKEDFELNFQILIEVTSLIQDIRLSDSETNHFFGDLFEGLLSKNVHQTEGQFFTPLPIVNFIIKSLPNFPNKESIKILDYACGAGHFLTEFLKAYPKTQAYGIEKSQPLSQVAKIATIINGAQDSHIVFKDALSIFNTQEVRFQGFDKESFDCLIANPPYSVDGFLSTLTEKDRKCFCLTELVGEKSYGSNDKIQCFFIERATHFIKKNGFMAIVLPVTILSNNDNLFKKTRELIFANFNILSIVGLNSRTFGSTGTNTIILFAQKVTKNSEGLLDSFISKKEYESYTNHKAIDEYIDKQGYNKDEFFALMQDCVLGTSLENHEMFSEYKREFKPQEISKAKQKLWFKDSPLYDTEKKENSKENKELFKKFLKSEEYKELVKTEHYKQFVLFAKSIERDKLNTFIQIHDNKVVLLQSPPDKIGNKSNKGNIIKFLGYDWSSRKNDEGIKYITNKPVEEQDEEKTKKNDKDAEILEAINSIKYIDTPLYNPNDEWDNTKFAFAIRKHIYAQCNKKFSFDYNCVNDIGKDYDGEMGNCLTVSRLSDLIKFNRNDFDKSIPLKEDREIKIESKYHKETLKEIVNIKGGDTFSKKYQGNLNSQDIPFYKVSDMNTQGNETIMMSANNYVSEDILKNNIRATIFEKNTIIFPKVGMAIHTNKKRILGRRAAVDNNTMAVWVKDDAMVNPYYLLNYFIVNVNLSDIASDANPPSISAKNLCEVTIPIPPVDIQEKIVSECQEIEKQYNDYVQIVEHGLQEIRSVISSLTGEKRKISKVCDINTTTINPSDNPKKEYVYVDIDAVENGTGIISWDKKIEGRSAPSRARRYAISGSTLISTVRPNLRGFAFIDKENKDAVYSTGFAILKSKDQSVLADKMIYYQFMYSDMMMQQMVEAMPQGSYPSINRGDIDGFDIVVSISDHEKVLRRLDEIEERVKRANEILANIPQRKQSVLDKYLKM